jgi:hypothetical protein
MYTVETGWVDVSGKTRNWRLIAPNGTEMAQVTRKKDALRLAEVLTMAVKLVQEAHG